MFKLEKYKGNMVELVSNKKLKRCQSLRYREHQKVIFDVWEAYKNKEKTVQDVLRVCSALNAPVVQAEHQ